PRRLPVDARRAATSDRKERTMKRANVLIGTGVVASVLVFALGVHALTKDSVDAVNAANTGNVVATGSDFSGVWKLDLAKSDLPRGGGMRGERRPEDRMNDRRGSSGDGDRGKLTEGMRGDRGGRGGMRRGGRLPATFSIEQQNGVLFVSDSTGTLVQQIATGAASADTSAAPTAHGEWKAGGLEIVRQGWGGRTSTETWSLGLDRASLVILTRMQSDQGAREFKRVYAR